MKGGDFRSNEKSMTIPAATEARIEFVGAGRQGHGVEAEGGVAGR